MKRCVWGGGALVVATVPALGTSHRVLMRSIQAAHFFYDLGGLGRFMAWYVFALQKLVFGLEIHPGAEIHPTVRFAHFNGVVIGRGVRVDEHVEIFGGVTLGHDGTWGFPHIGRQAKLFSGCVVAGPVVVPPGTRIGPNKVVVPGLELA